MERHGSKKKKGRNEKSKRNICVSGGPPIGRPNNVDSNQRRQTGTWLGGDGGGRGERGREQVEGQLPPL